MLADVAEQDGRVIAGGQTLVPAMALRFAQPTCLIDINGIESLQRFEVVGEEHLVIGACVRHSAFATPAIPGVLGCLLRDVVRHVAHLPIRTRGTFGGSIANADPAAEWCVVAATLDAVIEARSERGTRVIAARDYFLGFMATALAGDELLVSVTLPWLSPQTRYGFEEFSRRAGDFAQAMALVVLDVRDGVLTHVRIGVGGVESLPRRLGEAEALLEGKSIEPALIEAAAQAAAHSVSPVDTTEEEQAYRRRLVHTVVQRALLQAIEGEPARRNQRMNHASD